MLRSFFLIGTTGFWLTMMSLLIRMEFFELTPVQARYEVLPLHNLSLREEYRAVYLGKELIGFGFHVLEAMEESEGKKYPYELRHQTYLSFLFLGKEREMLVKGVAHLNERLEMQDFNVRVSSGDYWTQLTGQISRGSLNVVIEGKEGEPVRKIIPVAGPVHFSESLPLLWTPENLKIAKQGHLHVWNPLLMEFEDIRFRVPQKEKISYEEKEVDTFVVVTEKSGLETRAWVTPEGIMLREETPMGLVMQKEDAWKIFDAMRVKRGAMPDLPNLFSIPANYDLKNPLALSFLKVNVKSPGGEKIHKIKKNEFEGLESVALPVPLEEPAAFAPYLESSPLVQTDDPLIRETARAITASEASALMAALKLMRWVHTNVSPVPTVSLPSARQVLEIKKGDCNEYTVLFTALARSIGIPVKMVAGVVYLEGRFFYHAWPEIYLGRWIGLDPTFDQAPTDVAHIPLVEGNLEEQIALAGQMGKLQIVILEAR